MLKKNKFRLKRYCPPEHNEQVALFRWASVAQRQYPDLELMFAIPNGGQRNIVVATRLKAEGVKAGVPDIFLPVPRGIYHGLFIELKRLTGQTTDKQKQWLKALKEQGYLAFTCYGWHQAKNIIETYLNG